MTDLSHLTALQHRLSNEQARLSASKTDHERALRTVWVAGIEREIADEYKRLGIAPVDTSGVDTDELLAELMA